MQRREHNAPDAPSPKGGYANAVALEGLSHLVFVSGQVPVGREGEVPLRYEDQAAQAWANVDAQL